MAQNLPFGYALDYLLWWVVFASLLVHTWCFFRFFPRQRRPRLHLVLGNLLVFACLLDAAALISETYLRFMYLETDSRCATLPTRKWQLLYVRLNSMYCRDVEWIEKKPPGLRRIAFVGDSLTYGAGIENTKDRFSDRIQTRFDRQSPKAVEVMNVAWSGWDTQDQVEFLARLIPTYEVNELVLCYFPNDIERLLPTTEDFNPARHASCTWTNTDNSFLLDFLYHRVYVRMRSEALHYFDWMAEGYADDDIWSEQQRRLGDMISLCRSHGVTLRVALLPFIRPTGGKYKAEVIHGQIRRFFEQDDIPVVDLLPALSGRDPAELIVNRHDHHPNETAHRLFADAIWAAFYADGR